MGNRDQTSKKKVLICISGASGAGLGLKLYSLIPEGYQKFLVLSRNAQVVLEHEEQVYWEDEIYAPPASGSFGIDITFIVPTSMNTLAKIAAGIEDNLITRAAGVAIKEGKQLILAPRETPFSPIHIENMLKLSRLWNVKIAPPVVNYYIYPTSLEEMEYAIIGRWLDIAGIENDLFQRWGFPREERDHPSSGADKTPKKGRRRERGPKSGNQLEPGEGGGSAATKEGGKSGEGANSNPGEGGGDPHR